MLQTTIDTSSLSPAAAGLRAAYVCKVTGEQGSAVLVAWAAQNVLEDAGNANRLVGSRVVGLVVGRDGRAIPCHECDDFVRVLEIGEPGLTDVELHQESQRRALAADRLLAAELAALGGNVQL